jgi:hypothetical protein
MTINKFNRHLRNANQNYFSHFKDSIKYSLKSFKASICFLCHSVFPFTNEKSGSETIEKLHMEIIEKYKNLKKT